MRRQRQTDRQVGLSTASLSAIERLIRVGEERGLLGAWVGHPHHVGRRGLSVRDNLLSNVFR